MTKCSRPNVGLLQMEKELFWYSRDNGLIGPFPSPDEAEKDASDANSLSAERYEP
jgi:hypothetical protein